MAPEEAIKTVQMILTPSQGRPLPAVHLESVSPELLLPPPQAGAAPQTSLFFNPEQPLHHTHRIGN